MVIFFQTNRNMKVSFGSNPAIEILPTSSAQLPIEVSWTANSNSLYTLIMIDLDAPYPAPNNSKSPYLHLLITNIRGNNISTGDSLIEYMSPSPPSNSLPHTYSVMVYQQPSYINPVKHSKRENFEPSYFAKRHNLTLVSDKNFKVGNIVPTSASASISAGRKATTDRFFKPDTSLPEDKQKFCRCVIKVADKQRGRCNTEQAWFETRDGQQCYNPYRVCAASVGTTSRVCGAEHDFESFSDDHLITYAQLHQKSKDGINIVIPEPYDRSKMLENIRIWKAAKGK